ncbi:ABC transporter substrate-binding protein [Ideonella azotifigens]|uniref:ABC transporter substrate-binding protein n=1 Tax=Ideonella azotifigens TaxID=513160 RepID=A0ABN1JKG5_9BURK|nr:ABC transporter substrate-binding protein [Ideonella azotifigens]MCD2341849.1 ABC transporter substrate-binding protein [Ideonella azotifigens]
MNTIPRAAALAAFALVASLAATQAQAASIKISCGAIGYELELCKSAADAWAKKTGNEVQVVATPADSNERLALYQQILGSQSDKIDIFQIDVVWPGLLGTHLIDLTPYAKGTQSQHFESIVANNTVGGKLVAMPWFTDAGLLYYRKDLLEKYKQPLPVTWDDLAKSAKLIQEGERKAGNDRMWGYVWQGRAYEGLSCNALEWLVSFGGGSVVEPSGKISVNNPQAAEALQTAASWVGTISPSAVLNYAEEESRGVFQAGNAVYMRNWPYAWALSQAADSTIKGKVGITVLPKGNGANGRSAAALGGHQLAVSKYSKNPAIAADLVMYMTSAEVQKERAIKGSFNPTMPALYKDPEVLKANPFMGELYGTFASAAARPATVTGSHYNQVSNAFWNSAHEVLAGQAKATAALPQLETSLGRTSRGGKWN